MHRIVSHVALPAQETEMLVERLMSPEDGGLNLGEIWNDDLRLSGRLGKDHFNH